MYILHIGMVWLRQYKDDITRRHLHYQSRATPVCFLHTPGRQQHIAQISLIHSVYIYSYIRTGGAAITLAQ